MNNEQRQHNVALQMQSTAPLSVRAGPILLMDDYIGSGATLSEAIRALQDQAKIPNEIIPFTIAAVKWHIGKPGMI